LGSLEYDKEYFGKRLKAPLLFLPPQVGEEKEGSYYRGKK